MVRAEVEGAVVENDGITALYKKLGPSIYTCCRRLLRDAAAAEDATQEVFIRVAMHPEETADPAEALAWIYRVATNYCLNEIRSRKRRADLETSMQPVSAEHRSEDLIASRLLARRIIQRTPTRLSESAYLYHVDGMSHEEVAGALGHSRRTVINHIAEFGRRARKFLLRTP